MTLVWDRYGPVLVAATITAALAVAVGAILIRRRTARGDDHATARRRTVAELGIVVGTWPWLWMILTPADADRAVQLVPFIDLADVLTSTPSVVIVQVVGNLLVFAAWGFFAPIRFHIGVPGVALTALAASTTVETLQYALDIGRVSSIDDIGTNVLGAVLFALLSGQTVRVAHAPQRPARSDS